MTTLWLVAGCLSDSAPSGTSSPTSVTGTPTGDTGTPPSGTPAGLTDLGFRVHDDFRTLVYATWTQSVAGDAHIEYSYDPGVWWSTPVRSLKAGAHEEVLLGVPYGLSVTFHVVVDEPGGRLTSEDQAVQVDPLPAAFPPHELHTLDPERIDAVNAPYMYTALGDGVTYAAIIDRQGRVVWALRYPSNRASLHPRVSKDLQSLFVDYNSFWAIFDSGDASTIDQILLDGTVLHSFAAPGLHHPFTDLPDGSIAYGETTGGYGNEYITVVQPDDSVQRIFDCEAWLSAIGVNDSCMSNTLNYDADTNKYLFSMWTMETIIEVDGTTGDVARWFGHTAGAYSFDPLNSTFWWQHGGYITDAGTLLTSSDRNDSGTETVVREYEIDDATQTLREVWSFGVGLGVYGFQMGEAIRLPNGNTWHNYGDLARIREATPEGDVVWDLEWDADLIGRSMPVADLYALVPPRP